MWLTYHNYKSTSLDYRILHHEPMGKVYWFLWSYSFFKTTFLNYGIFPRLFFSCRTGVGTIFSLCKISSYCQAICTVILFFFLFPQAQEVLQVAQNCWPIFRLNYFTVEFRMSFVQIWIIAGSTDTPFAVGWL